MDLSRVELRVLGALVEKDMVTPDYYPLSLNALTAACNQKTNREPVVAWDDSAVLEGLESLRARHMVAFVHEAGSRVVKYRHRLGELFNFTRGELALVAVLVLRGPQTAAELRERSSRLHSFDDAASVEQALERLSAREPEPLARLLPRQPGTKEPRWAHLMGGEPEWHTAAEAAVAVSTPLAERVERLEQELRELREEFDRFRSQF